MSLVFVQWCLMCQIMRYLNLFMQTRLPRANRQPRSRPHQNPSNRRRTVPHVPFSNRMSQLRSRMINRPSTPTTSFRGRRRPRFPLDIDLDMVFLTISLVSFPILPVCNYDGLII